MATAGLKKSDISKKIQRITLWEEPLKKKLGCKNTLGIVTIGHLAVHMRFRYLG